MNVVPRAHGLYIAREGREKGRRHGSAGIIRGDIEGLFWYVGKDRREGVSAP